MSVAADHVEGKPVETKSGQGNPGRREDQEERTRSEVRGNSASIGQKEGQQRKGTHRNREGESEKKKKGMRNRSCQGGGLL